MRNYLIAAEIVAVLAVFALIGGWYFFRAGPDAKALHGAMGKIPLPAGYDEFRLNGDERDPSFFISATYSGKPTLPEIMAFYQTYFDENGWTNNFPDDEPTDGSLDYIKELISMHVTAFNLRGQTHLMVIYREFAHTREDFDALVPESATPEAQALVDDVTTTYAALTSYRDTGTLETIAEDEDPEYATFSTAYVAPNQLRFSYADAPESFDPARYELAAKGNAVQTMADYDDGPETLDDLSLAISGLYGVTMTTSGNIPQLLLGPKGESTLFHLIHLTLLDEANADDGTPCLRLQGSNFIGAVDTIWIGNDDLLIRKIESVTDRHNRETITYTPEANIDIPAADLEFRRP